MRKKIFSSVFALALLATAGWGVNKSMSNDAGLSDLALANVEALADGENPGTGDGCKSQIKGSTYEDLPGGYYTITYSYGCSAGVGLDCRLGDIVLTFNDMDINIGMEDKRTSVNCT